MYVKTLHLYFFNCQSSSMLLYEMLIGLKHDGVLWTQSYFLGTGRNSPAARFIQNATLFVGGRTKLGGKDLVKWRICSDTSSSKRANLMIRKYVTWYRGNIQGLMIVVVSLHTHSSLAAPPGHWQNCRNYENYLRHDQRWANLSFLSCTVKISLTRTVSVYIKFISCASCDPYWVKGKKQ